jgi:hypothetical protein
MMNDELNKLCYAQCFPSLSFDICSFISHQSSFVIHHSQHLEVFMTMIKNTVWLVVMIFLLSGCATHSDELRGQGAGVGAAAGAGLGYLLGGKDGAAFGAVLGALVGFTAGHEVARRKEQYASQEEAIVTETKRIRQVTEQTQSYNAQLQRTIQTNRVKIAELEATQNRTQENEAALKEQYERTAQLHVEAENALKGVENELDVQQQLYAEYEAQSQNAQDYSQDLKNWQTKIVQLEAEKQTLQSNLDTLTALNPNL